MNIVAEISSLSRTALDRPDDVALSENDRLTELQEEAADFCERFGIGEDIVLETYTETSDWAFFIKIDALLETACRDLMSRLLKMRQGGGARDQEMAAFIHDMEFQGRSSLLRLLELGRCPASDVQFLQSVHSARDAFAHDLRALNATLVELMESRADRKRLLKAFAAAGDDGFDEAKFIRRISVDPGLLRFGILHRSMVLLRQLHADFHEAEKDAAASPKTSLENEVPAKESVRSNADLAARPAADPFHGETRAFFSATSEDRSDADRKTPAVFLRRSFTNPKRPNQIRSLGTYLLAFSAKGSLAIIGFAAAAVVYSFYGVWPAIAAALIGLAPIALDRWTPGAWKGLCPHCDSEIMVAPPKKNGHAACPLCAGRIRLHDQSFIAS